jgi:predicted HNH restriction endonuclease
MSRNAMPPERHEQAITTAGYQCLASSYQFGSTYPCSGRLVVHHKKPRGMGGTPDPTIHDLDNLAVLCDTHHREVHANPTRSYNCGLLIRR